MRVIENVLTNVVLGFLGVGKTTAMLDWVSQKPIGESWSVLVNEFGEVGIDGAMYRRRGVAVKEIPGGCMCCAQGLPLQVAVNRLLRATRPDRLLIETSGIGHPAGVLKTLQGQGFHGVLQLKAVIGLVDPEQLLDQACLDNELFIQQLAYADVLVANKTDLASARAMEEFEGLSARFKVPKAVTESTVHGRMQLNWLDDDHTDRRADVAPLTLAGPRGEWQSYSWRFPETVEFDLQALKAWVRAQDVIRLKGIVNTNQGGYVVNYAANELTVEAIGPRQETRLQIIDWPAKDRDHASDRFQALEQALDDCKQPAKR